jgi:hypothetical protein
MPANPKIKSVNVPYQLHQLLSTEAKRLELSQGDYTAACVRYFAERGLNPVEIDAREGQLIMQEMHKHSGLSTQQVKKLGDRIFSYLQVQERELLVPMLHEMLRTRVTLDRVLRMNEILVNNLTTQLQQLTPPQLAQRKESLQKLRQQNEDMLAQQIQQAIDNTQPTATA